MNILVLEDSYERIEWFRERLPQTAGVYYTDKVDEAIKLLERVNFHVIFLDHDLKLQHYDDLNCLDDDAYLKRCENVLDKETGVAVAKYLNENPNASKDAQIIIHTMNTLGQERMGHLLEARNPRIVPFSALRHLLVSPLLKA